MFPSLVVGSGLHHLQAYLIIYFSNPTWDDNWL